MEDLAGKLEQLLNSPDGMEKIRSAMEAFGVTGGSSSEKENSSSDLLAALTADNSAGKAATSDFADLSALTKLAPLLSQISGDDENTRLLKALRPYLHGGREQKLDETIQMMRLARMLPMITKDKEKK